jgi:ABC-2 type transport system permease protein
MKQAVHAEWTKLRTLSSTWWLLLASVVSTVAVGAATTAAIDTSQCPAREACLADTTRLSLADPTRLSLAGTWLGQVSIAVLAVLAITNEYSNRLIHTTFAMNPRRGEVLAAKAATITAAVLAAGTLGVLGSLIAGRIILPGNGFTAANGYPPLSLAHEPTLRAAVGTVLYLGLIALLSLGIGTLVRDTAVAVAAVLSLMFVVPIVAQLIGDPQWSRWLQRYSPTNAGLAIQATTRMDELPIGPWAGLGLLAGYAAAALVTATALLANRDA